MRRALFLSVMVVGAVATVPWESAARQTQPGDAAQVIAAQVIDVQAERFQFTPSEIKTTVGTTLTIRLKSEDTTHGFRIIGTDVNVEIPKRSRGVATVTFTPKKAGRYTFECAHLCGAGHSFMRGVIVVTAPPEGTP